MTLQPSLFNTDTYSEYPELTISEDSKDAEYAKKLLKQAKLEHLIDITEVWNINYSSKKLSYLTHNIFRFFGKFPPPIARHLILRYTDVNEMVYDPMVGSGTTAIEALLLNRRVFCSDVSPLSELLILVKCQPMKTRVLYDYLKSIKAMYFSTSFKTTVFEKDIPLPQKSLRHWFLKETISNLLKLLSAIQTIDNKRIKNFFLACFISVVRKVSRATTQQGRLFLDKATAVEDVWPDFEKLARRLIKSVGNLPSSFAPPTFILSDIRKINELPEDPKLVICHPPYFNVYKFSTIFTLELAWLFADRTHISKEEVREYFKIGKPENVQNYVSDMKAGILKISSLLKPNTIFALMIGDTKIHGNHIPTTSYLLNEIEKSNLNLISIAVRRPKFTEASWVASQRRTSKHIGVNLSDYLLTFKVE